MTHALAQYRGGHFDHDAQQRRVTLARSIQVGPRTVDRHVEAQTQPAVDLDADAVTVAVAVPGQREQARLLGQVGELQASAAQAEGRITEIEIEKLKLVTTRREQAITELRDLQYRELELAERRQSLRQQLDRLDIRAPVSGVVYGLTVFAERSVIRAADPVLYLVPQDRPLVVAARIDPIHRDEVYVGQPVTLRFATFDARTTPELYGTVMQVSADAFTDEQAGASFYRAEMVLNEGENEKLGDLRIVPGMPVEAFIRTSDRTPLAYLLKPLTDYFNRAFRES